MLTRFSILNNTSKISQGKTQKKVTKRHHPVSLKSLKLRMKSITAIGKVTTTMKVIASSKMQITQDIADQASTFFLSMRDVLKPIEEKLNEGVNENTKIATVLVMSNKGLCGGLNSAITRQVVAEPNIGNETVILLGEKAKRAAETQSLIRPNVPFSIHTDDKNSLSFIEAADISSRLLAGDYDQIRIVYNRYESLTNMYVDSVRLPSIKSLSTPAAQEILSQFDIGDNPEEAVEALLSYYYASAMTFVTTQNAAVELFFRRNAMNAASDNAESVGKQMQLLYNKTRQAGITTELIEITSGAAVVADSN
eukprot:TRINITY_DN9362_c0_g1_i1.p1 TRINITY_DN9362_c0_g1~~TRINITY_DN9362_c0_g1_i1.p1  ORF type:complete len:309 (-),score=82.92 TRINITY_DN9362_c0_g1_i1:90-1016(-)